MVHRERFRRVSAEYGTTEDNLNECQERVGQLIRAGDTRAWSCGVTDRDCSAVKYLQEAWDMIEDFQRRDTRREIAENFLVERPR